MLSDLQKVHKDIQQPFEFFAVSTFRLRIAQKYIETIDEVCAIERISTDTNAKGLS